MARLWSSVLMLLALCTAGCVEPTASQEDAVVPEVLGPTVLPYGLRECDYVVAVVSVDAARLAERLPAGFELVLSNMAPGAPPSAALGLEAFSCADEGLGDTPAGYAYGSVFAGVVPNATFQKDDIEEYYVKWDTLVANATKRTIMQGHGIAAHEGLATVSIQSTGLIAAVDAALDMGNGGSFSIRGAGSVGSDAPGFEYIEYTPAGNATLGAWHSTTLTRTLFVRAQGTLSVDTESWYGQLIGRETAPASIVAGRWSFAPGNITVPVQTAGDVR